MDRSSRICRWKWAGSSLTTIRSPKLETFSFHKFAFPFGYSCGYIRAQREARQLFRFFSFCIVFSIWFYIGMTPITIVLVHIPKNEKYLYFWKVAEVPRKLYTYSVLGSPWSDFFNSLMGLLEMMPIRAHPCSKEFGPRTVTLWHYKGAHRKKRIQKYQKF